MISADVVGPKTLLPGDTAPFGWQPESARLTRGGVHYVSADYVHLTLVTDRCTAVSSVRVGSRVVTPTNSNGYFYSDVTRQAQTIPPIRSASTQTSFQVNPFLAVGYKAYVTDRAFFRNDLRVAFRGGFEETVLRIGFGFDF